MSTFKDKTLLINRKCLLLMIIKKCLEAVHSTWKTWRRTEKKFSVLHKTVNIRQNCRRDIVDDRVNGKALHQPVELLRR